MTINDNTTDEIATSCPKIPVIDDTAIAVRIVALQTKNDREPQRCCGRSITSNGYGSEAPDEKQRKALYCDI